MSSHMKLTGVTGVVGPGFGRMNAQFGRGQPEDKPASAGVDVLEAKDVTEHSAQGVRFRGVQQHVSANNSHVNSSGPV